MNYFKDSLAISIIVLVAAVIIIAFYYFIARFSCHQRWKDAGLESRFTLLGGCQLQIDGRWIPAENYRQVP